LVVALRRAASTTAERGGVMNGWEIIAWFAIAAVAVLRVALVVGVIALIVAIVRGVRATEPISHAG
jgi:hypothetical protein